MHDSLKLEEMGIPTVAVATGEFRIAARAQASMLGRPDYEAVFVPHPIQDQTPEEIEVKAACALGEIVRRIGGQA